MLIDNVETFKSWLTIQLTPICDADPAALAKYVVALVRKDKPTSELREACLDQLDVFLQSDTNEFVKKLFTSLEEKTYLKPADEAPANNSEPKEQAKPPPVVREEKVEEKEIQHPPARSRSPYDRNRKGRYDDRPRSSRYDDRRRRRTRSRSWSRSRSRSMSPRSTRSRGRLRSRSPDKGPRPHSPKDGNSHHGSNIPTEWNQPPPPKPRCRDFDEKGFCMLGDLCPCDHGIDPVVVEDVNLPNMISFQPPNSGPGPSIPPHGPPQPMRPPPPRMGGPPPFRHQGPPPRMPGPPMPGQGPPQRGPPPRHGPRPPRPMDMGRPSFNKHVPYQPEQYNPEAPGIRQQGPPPPGFWPRPQGNQGPRMPMVQRQREIVSVPREPQEATAKAPEDRRQVIQGRREFRHEQGERDGGPPNKRGHFDFSRLGNQKPHFDPNNACLEVRKIPKQFNNISKLNEHFGQFGTIVNLQVCYCGDQEAALVTFANNMQARAAYKSSEPVFNNRFIKVFWHKPTAQDGGNEPSKESAPSVKDRLTIPAPHKLQLNNTLHKTQPEKDTSLSQAHSITKTVINPAAMKEKVAAVKAAQLEVLKQKEENKKETLRKKMEINKQKQNLLTKALEQQKLLIGRIDKNKNMGADEKKRIMKTIKTLAKQIENLKKELTPQSTVPKTRQQAEKQLLDVELELYNRQTTGDDTSDLRRKVEALRTEAASLGLISRGRGHGRGRGRGRGSVRGRGRGRGVVPSTGRSVDRRPRALNVSGFDADEIDELTAHLYALGEIETLDINKDAPSATVTFNTRKAAEKAASTGVHFKDKDLVMSWHVPKIRTRSVSEAELTGQAVDEDGDDEEVDEDALLGEEEEEDEDDEDRSWRR